MIKNKKYEIKIGFHWAGDPYPCHSFKGTEDWMPIDPDSKIIMRSNEELRTHLEERWKKTPEREKLMYFYIQVHKTGIPVIS